MSSVSNVSVIGLGKLGASMAAGMAERGFDVIGVDVSKKAVEAVNAGLAPVQETDLEETIRANRERIRATMNHTEAVLGSDISFVIVPTPSDDRGSFSLQYATFAFKALGKALKVKKGYHVIVLTSTVLPGSTRYGLLPVLEQASDKKCGTDFGLCYSPEFIALGTVIRDFLNPDFYLIGEFDERSGDMLEAVNRRLCSKSNPVCRRMSIENAEIAKIALNSFVTMKISFANILTDLCERVPGGDVDVVSDAIGSDSRIGRKYLSGGLGFAGPCFPRDNVALSYFARQLEASCELLEVNDKFNKSLSRRYLDKLKPRLKKNATVAVLGLAYKPLSHIIEESPGVYLCQVLSDAGYRVIGYDPLAGPSAEAVLKYHALVSDSLRESLQDAEVILVTTQDDQFKALTPEDVLGNKERVQVVDFWRCLSPEIAIHPRIDYLPAGRCLDDEKWSNCLRQLWERKE
jgi:UDPglucose 6-dehydrogenase